MNAYRYILKCARIVLIMAEDSTEESIIVGVLIVIMIIMILYFLISTGIIKFQFFNPVRIA